MDKTLTKKLKAYSLTAGSLTAAATAATAQINYTDVIPDAVIDSGAVYLLDMNNDAATDLTLTAGFYTDSLLTYGYAISILPPTAAGATLGNLYSSTIPLPFALNPGDNISPSSADWRDTSVFGGTQFLAYVYPQPGPVYGNWAGQNDKYIGIRFNAGTQVHYGWARLSVSTDGQIITLKDYAFNTVAGQGLTAGQTVSVAENTGDVPQMHVYDRTLFVTLTPQMQLGGTLQVFKTTGQVVYTESINEASMRISLGEMASGVYLVQVIQPNGEVVTRKIYL